MKMKKKEKFRNDAREGILVRPRVAGGGGALLPVGDEDDGADDVGRGYD